MENFGLKLSYSFHKFLRKIARFQEFLILSANDVIVEEHRKKCCIIITIRLPPHYSETLGCNSKKRQKNLN